MVRRRAGDPFGEKLPALFRRPGRHARIFHQRARRADAAHRIGHRRPEILLRGAAQKPDRRLLRIPGAQKVSARQAGCGRKRMIYAAGIDVGSTQTKGIIIDQDQRIIARALGMTGANVTRAGANCFNEALKLANVKREDVRYVVGTGYGRYKVTFGDAPLTEISCSARGAFYLFPNTKTVIDMGGQDAKGIKIGEGGEVKDFVMNDKCAAGTGRVLGSAAEALMLSLDDIGELSLKAKTPGAPHTL